MSEYFVHREEYRHEQFSAFLISSFPNNKELSDPILKTDQHFFRQNTTCHAFTRRECANFGLTNDQFMLVGAFWSNGKTSGWWEFVNLLNEDGRRVGT